MVDIKDIQSCTLDIQIIGEGEGVRNISIIVHVVLKKHEVMSILRRHSILGLARYVAVLLDFNVPIWVSKAEILIHPLLPGISANIEVISDFASLFVRKLTRKCRIEKTRKGEQSKKSSPCGVHVSCCAVESVWVLYKQSVGVSECRKVGNKYIYYILKV